MVREELARSQGEDTLVLGAPSVDITNQDTSMGIMDGNMVETMASSIAMVEAAEYALKSGKVKQVILLEHLPRFDVDEKDKDKPALAKLANKELNKARDASDFAENILVGQHTGLECEGRTRINRFTSDHTNGLHGRHVRMGKYDGIHMYSQAGAEALTKSILGIFQKAGMIKNKKKSSSNSIQQAASQTSSTPIQQAEQDWVTINRGSTNQNYYRNNMVEVPLWEIPTQNQFQGFC